MNKKSFLKPPELILIVVGVIAMFFINSFSYNKNYLEFDDLYPIVQSKVDGIDYLYRNILYNAENIEKSNSKLVSHSKQFNKGGGQLEREKKQLMDLEQVLLDIPYNDIRRHKFESKGELEKVNEKLDKLIYELLTINDSLDQQLKDQKSILSLVYFSDQVNGEFQLNRKINVNQYYDYINSIDKETLASLNSNGDSLLNFFDLV